jgi:hypothetical protein
MYENPSVHPILAGLIGIAAGVGIGYLAFKPATATTPAAGTSGLPGLGLTNPLTMLPYSERPEVIGHEQAKSHRDPTLGAVGRQTTQAQLVQSAHSNGMAYGVASARWLIMNGRPVAAIDPSGIGVQVPAPFNTWGTAAVHGFQGGFVLGYNQVRNSAQAKAQNAPTA